jgi:hypothetical protein
VWQCNSIHSYTKKVDNIMQTTNPNRFQKSSFVKFLSQWRNEGGGRGVEGIRRMSPSPDLWWSFTWLNYRLDWLQLVKLRFIFTTIPVLLQQMNLFGICLGWLFALYLLHSPYSCGLNCTVTLFLWAYIRNIIRSGKILMFYSLKTWKRNFF